MYSSFFATDVERPYERDHLQEVPEAVIPVENDGEDELFEVLDYGSLRFVESEETSSQWSYVADEEDYEVACWRRDPVEMEHFEARIEEGDILLNDYTRIGTVGPGVLTHWRQKLTGEKIKDARTDLDQLKTREEAYLTSSEENFEKYIKSITGPL